MHRIAPVPCLNGSPAQDLMDQMLRISAVLKDACAAMRTWQPHGGEYMADRNEYVRRLRLVEELAAQYESEAYSLNTREV